MFELIIRNGRIIDGSGSSETKADLAIHEGRIVEIGTLENSSAKKEINAQGLIVCPGFIDMHSHEDGLNLISPLEHSFIQQGITSAVTGNCGISLAPLTEATKEQGSSMLGKAAELIPWNAWDSFGSYLEFVQKKGISVNMIPLVGQGAVRSSVMEQTAAHPDAEQMRKMQEVVIQCMEEGAFGLSTGLIYPPGSYATTEELIEVTRPVGKRYGFYFSHVRGEGDTLLDAIQEEISIGQATGASLQHSHYKATLTHNWEKAAQGLKMIEAAQKSGLDFSMDMYPYTAGSTRLIALLPEWAQEGGTPAVIERLTDPQTRSKITESMKNNSVFFVDDWSKILIPSSANPAHVGRNVAEMAEESAKSAYDWVYDAILETKGNITVVLFQISEDNVRMQMQHPSMMFGTDGFGMPFEGPLAAGAPHPRSFGTFPRILGKYVRQEKVLTLEKAIYKMSGQPAKKLRLKERGLLKKGYKADVVIFNPDTVIDKADFSSPFQPSLGIEFVLVNGKIAVENGLRTSVISGEVIKPI